ncbi:MAG: CHRD domain-containing protein [Actinobacteria bacterium]|nr:CHRD domain-containing protein [Actinomycetota bacterium]
MRKISLLILSLALVMLAAGCANGAPTTTTGVTAVTTTTLAGTSTSVIATSSTTQSAPSTTQTTVVFTAELSGKEVVPAVDTMATGSATFTVDPTLTRVHFELKLSNITGVIASRVHEGEPGTNGRGLLILFPGPTWSGTFTGVLSEGNFNASALIGSLTGKTIADFVALLKSGQAYVNVGTLKNPKGEIRGQIH